MSEWNKGSIEAANKLEDFILKAKWEEFPETVRDRAVTCFLDLVGVMIAGTKTRMAQSGIELAKRVFKSGDIPVLGCADKLNVLGAVTAYGYNVNALDMDDGHNLIKGHPGAVLVAGILPVAIETNSTYEEMLTALVIGYEVAVRAGMALHKYYGFYHGTGSWGAFGVAAATARLYKVDRKTLSNALGIADYQGPIAPVMRIVEIPSMNKDGIAWGAVTGVMAVEAARSGITGQFYNLMEPQNREFVETLGKDYEIMNLYFKYFPCCRWAHAPIIAALNIKDKTHIEARDIKKIEIRTFEAATKLSSVKPKYCDEAQYNMIYPVCTALIEGEFVPIHVSEEYIEENPEILELMERVEYFVGEEFEKEFPRKRYAQMKIYTRKGECLSSKIVEPWGEKEENVGVEWVSKKLKHTTRHCFSIDKQEEIIEKIIRFDANMCLEALVECVNRGLTEVK